MKRISLILAALLALMLALSGCNSGGNKAAADMIAPAEPSAAPEYWYGESAPAGGGPANDSLTDVNSGIYNDPENKVIRTAEMTIQTIEFEQAVANLAALTESLGGYYETAQVEGGGYYDQYICRSAYYVVRIPRENFTKFRDGSGGIGHLYSITEDSQNIGETYYDTEARLATLTTKRERLLSLLEKAELMEDIITLEDALANVQYEIDMHTASLRKYDSLIDYSTFRIHLDEVRKIVEEPGPEDGFGVKLLSNLRDGAERFGEGVQSFVLWLARNLIGVIVFAAVVAAAVVIGRKQVRKRRKANNTDTD